MTREDLFQALGEVEETRLMKTELSITGKPKGRHLRNILIAAVLVSALALTAVAAGYLLFDSPQAMISAIFGDNTGFDQGEYTEIPDPERPGSILAAQPEYDRVEADPAVVQEDIAPYVSPVGKTISYHGMTLTVDSFVYDNATRCGVVTYTLENGPEYYLQYDGSVSYMGRPDPVEFSYFGNSYIIQEKTTETSLAAACYFHLYKDDGPFYMTLRDGMTHQERMDLRRKATEEVEASYTPEEMVAIVREKLGEDFDTGATENGWTKEELALEYLRDLKIMEWMEDYQDTSEERIDFDCSESRELKHLTLMEGGVTVSPISMVVDIGKLPFLWVEGKPRNSDLMDSIVLRFSDGTEFTLMADQVSNMVYNLNSTADGTMDTEYTIFTTIFNRVVDLDALTAVVINEQEVPA